MTIAIKANWLKSILSLGKGHSSLYLLVTIDRDLTTSRTNMDKMKKGSKGPLCWVGLSWKLILQYKVDASLQKLHHSLLFTVLWIPAIYHFALLRCVDFYQDWCGQHVPECVVSVRLHSYLQSVVMWMWSIIQHVLPVWLIETACHISGGYMWPANG